MAFFILPMKIFQKVQIGPVNLQQLVNLMLIFRLWGPPVTVAPPKQEKKVFGKKNYAFDSNDSYNAITIKEKVK